MNYLALVNDALSLIAVRPEGQDATAEQGQLALSVASAMLEEWADEGIFVSWPAAPTLDDLCGLAGTERTAVTHALALRLCPHFGREPPPSLVGLAMTTFNRLARQQMLARMEESNAVLPAADAGGAWYDIERGE